MSDIDQAQTYLRMAGKDYRALLAMLDPDGVDVEIFGFHVQQAVEKGLKAWLCLLGVRFPKKHDLRELGTLLSQSDVTLPEHFVPLLGFSDFATTFRYDAYPTHGMKLPIRRILSRNNRAFCCALVSGGQYPSLIGLMHWNLLA